MVLSFPRRRRGKLIFWELIHQSRILVDLPGEAPFVEGFHEGIGVEFFHVPHARAAPDALQDEHGAYHGRDAGGVGDGLAADFFIALFVVADVVDIEVLLDAVLHALEDAADMGLALGPRPQGRGVGQDGLEEVEGDDLLALE